MIIIFEGPDKSGKSTLFKALAKARQYKDTYIDRMFPSDIIYAVKYDRGYKQLMNLVGDMNTFNTWNRPFYVFVTASIGDTIDSFKKANEEYDVNEIDEDKLRYEQFYDGFEYRDKMQINRTGLSVDECIAEILKHL